MVIDVVISVVVHETEPLEQGVDFEMEMVKTGAKVPALEKLFVQVGIVLWHCLIQVNDSSVDFAVLLELFQWDIKL